MSTVTFRDVAIVLTPVLLFILGVGVGIIGFFLRAMHRDIKEKFKHAEKKVDRVERDLLEFKASLPSRYVLKDDFIRVVSGFDYKLDQIFTKIDSLIRGTNAKP